VTGRPPPRPRQLPGAALAGRAAPSLPIGAGGVCFGPRNGDLEHDRAIRLAAFAWLREQERTHGDVLPWSLLSAGFAFGGRRVPLVGQQGIFKPAVLPRLPLSIRTSAGGPYDDAFGADGLLRYRYRGTDPHFHENVRLREAMRLRVPLIYLHGVVEGRYLTVWPVYLVGDDPARLTFTVAADDQAFVEEWAGRPLTSGVAAEGTERRAYITATVLRRLHQRGFRERVLQAYRDCCALCRLRHKELLDAAHIVPDADPAGVPSVRNGLALCKLHHAAFDGSLLGVRPDYRIEVRPDVLQERDGPMLIHGLQGLHERMIELPRSAAARPDPALLEIRYQRFKAAS
jgi:putative restriction endonuclease